MNRPEIKVRCRTDPLAFAKFGNPAFEQRDGGMWIAEHEGIAEVHYHKGALRETQFTRKIGGELDMTKPQLLDGKPWIDTTGLWADQIPNAKPKMGGTEHETFTMLATTQQDGYSGRHFDITMKDGRDIRLRGPWHGGAPDGYQEVYYYIDDRQEYKCRPGSRHYRTWHDRGGFFGLYVQHEVMIDILSTFQPHLELAWVERIIGKQTYRTVEPLMPETGLPKGIFVPVDECPGHQFSVTIGSAGPHDRCAFCELPRSQAGILESEAA